MTQPTQPTGITAPMMLLVGILVGGGFLTMMLWDSIPRREPRPRQEHSAGPVVELTEKNWQAEVLDSKTPVLVDFWAEWCGPCLKLAPTIDKLASRFEGRVKVGKVDLDTNKQLVKQFDIESIPHVMLFTGGKQPARTLEVVTKASDGGVRFKTEDEFAQEIERILKGT